MNPMLTKYCPLFFAFLMMCAFRSSGQSYGLGFAGHEVVQEKRTGLDLSLERPMCFDQSFELSFDLSFVPGQADYFGYIFRVIDQQNRNIDLIYDMRFLENKHFKLIVGDKISDIAFDISINSLYKHWHNLKLKFDIKKQELTMVANGKSYLQKVSLNKSCYKVLFGANNYKDFKVKDVPPMRVREVKITEGNKTNFYWPLDQISGVRATENIGGREATVANPIWIKKMHHDWELVKTVVIKGVASTALAPEKEDLYLITTDSLITYNITSGQFSGLGYKSKKQQLLGGNQSLYDKGTKRLFNFYIDQKLVTDFDFTKQTWSKPYISPDVITNYWHPNKFYSSADSSLYIIGGYGQYIYKKSVFRYHVPDSTWESVGTKGEFTPRYLSALGVSKKGAYILGGYGSATGQQILNPKNIYDLSFFDVKSRTFKKLFELKPKKEEFAFANSMVIDEDSGTYYALIFPNQKYNSSLQLIKGSLTEASYELAGNEIPYAFHDIHSFADLFYCPESKKFVTISLFHDEKTNLTTAKIYVLSGPPELASAASPELWLSKNSWLMLTLGALLLIAFIVLYRKRKEKLHQPSVVGQKTVPHVIEAGKELEKPETLSDMTSGQSAEIKNAILLFGDLQLFDRDGNDITKYFTPLIRELFLVVLLYTIKWGRGISTEKLTEILWFDKTADSARNNRSVNIAKLKTILEKMDSCQISKKTGYWKIIFEEQSVKIDYSQYLNIVNSKGEIDKQRINELTQIIHRGSFLSNVEYDWLDAFKSEISNEIIDTYLHYANTVKIADDPEFLINLANYVFYFDQVNEAAMIIKCKALVHLGKHSLAKTKFETFCKEYKAIYGEEYKQTFQTILE
ncbi:MAG: galactose oxidase [Pedobacter sp.]|nr:MAG: galactose oxidase [Pedobacter sp.]